MKKIGDEFKLLTPGAEKAIVPIWLAIAERMKTHRPDCDTVFWRTDSASGFLAVRLIDSANDETSQANDFLYSTPSIGQASKVLLEILGESYCDETLRPFQITYEIWVDHILRVSFAHSKAQSAFRSLIKLRPNLHIVATSIDEGLSGDLRIIWGAAADKKLPSVSPAAKKRGANKKVAVLNRPTGNRRRRNP